ncbi:unnamed protein product [Linum tenue]|nr:unnamed protein product [Linum tenue]
MSGEDVSWTPYGRDAGTEVLCSLYTGVIRFADVAEGYDPARCRRQFGYRQTIPRTMMVPKDVYRPASCSTYIVFWEGSMDQFWCCGQRYRTSPPPSPLHMHEMR